jgi:hypothetical protein
MSGTKGDFDRIYDAVLTYETLDQTLDDVLKAAAFVIPSTANPTLSLCFMGLIVSPVSVLSDLCRTFRRRVSSAPSPSNVS